MIWNTQYLVNILHWNSFDLGLTKYAFLPYLCWDCVDCLTNFLRALKLHWTTFSVEFYRYALYIVSWSQERLLKLAKNELNENAFCQDEILHCSELVYSFLSQSRDQIQSTRHQRTSVYPDEEVVPERGTQLELLTGTPSRIFHLLLVMHRWEWQMSHYRTEAI